jgi:chorismate synthase
MMSIPAAKGFESGDGFAGTLLTGKEHNDEFYIDPVTGATRTRTNRSGGIQGGISNGENIVITVAFKPTSTIGQAQVRHCTISQRLTTAATLFRSSRLLYE